MGVKVKHFISPADISPDIIQSVIFDAIKESQPEYVFFSSVNPSSGYPFSWSYLEKIKAVSPLSKFIFVWWDSCCDDFFKLSIDGSQGLVDLNIFLDNPTLSGLTEAQVQDCNVRFYPLNYPVGVFVPGIDRKYQFSFVGQLTGKRLYRKPFIDAAASLDSIPHFISAYSRETQTSLDHYVSVVQSSVSTINFCRSLGINQLKGRVWEAFHSCSFLLEETGSPVDQLFVPGLEYETFSSPEELVDKLKFYCLTSKGIRLAEAKSARAYEKLCSTYNQYQVLKDVIGALR